MLQNSATKGHPKASISFVSLVTGSEIKTKFLAKVKICCDITNGRLKVSQSHSKSTAPESQCPAAPILSVTLGS